VGSDQEYIRRAFVYSANKMKIPTLLMEVGISSNTTNVASIAMKRTVFRLRSYAVNILRKYSYLLRTVIALRWNPLKIIKMIIKDIIIALTIDDARGMFGCQAITIAGSWEKKVLVERGVLPEDIYVTGNPHINIRLNHDKPEARNQLCQELGIDVQDKVILLLTCAQVEHGRWTVKMREDFINGIIDTILPITNDHVKLFIKIHPVENLGIYEKVIQGKKNVFVRKDVVLVDAINASDIVVIGGYSTTVLEACAMRKPVVLITVFNEVNHIPFVEMGLADEIYSYAELRPQVEELLYDDNARVVSLLKAKKFFDANTEFIDGRATERITELITSLVQSSKVSE